jgi:hypothetical protein
MQAGTWFVKYILHREFSSSRNIRIITRSSTSSTQSKEIEGSDKQGRFFDERIQNEVSAHVGESSEKAWL